MNSERKGLRHTTEDQVHRYEVRGDGKCDHGDCEGEQLEDDFSNE
jgi:hypothetical protein